MKYKDSFFKIEGLDLHHPGKESMLFISAIDDKLDWVMDSDLHDLMRAILESLKNENIGFEFSSNFVTLNSSSKLTPEETIMYNGFTFRVSW